ncbi:unnamed protein product [Closterium sp. NIES-64]|nr:unnamed protein product [Closterium sp. NIES-64]
MTDAFLEVGERVGERWARERGVVGAGIGLGGSWEGAGRWLVVEGGGGGDGGGGGGGGGCGKGAGKGWAWGRGDVGAGRGLVAGSGLGEGRGGEQEGRGRVGRGVEGMDKEIGCVRNKIADAFLEVHRGRCVRTCASSSRRHVAAQAWFGLSQSNQAFSLPSVPDNLRHPAPPCSLCEEDHIPAVADRMVLRKLVPTDRIMVLRKLAQDMREWIHRRVSHGIRGDCYGMVPVSNGGAREEGRRGIRKDGGIEGAGTGHARVAGLREREVYEAGCRGSLLCSLSPHSSPNPPPLPLHASFQRLFPTPLAHTTPPHLLPTPSLLPLSPTPFPHAFSSPPSPPPPLSPTHFAHPIPPPTPFPHAFFSPLSPTSFPHAFSSPPSPPPSLSPSHFAHPFPPPTPFPHAISSPLSPFKRMLI